MAQLPPGSRLARSQDPDAAWGTEAMFLRLIEYELRGVLYGLGGAKGERPEPIELPSERAGKERMLAEAEAAQAEVYERLRDFLPDT